MEKLRLTWDDGTDTNRHYNVTIYKSSKRVSQQEQLELTSGAYYGGLTEAELRRYVELLLNLIS